MEEKKKNMKKYPTLEVINRPWFEQCSTCSMRYTSSNFSPELRLSASESKQKL